MTWTKIFHILDIHDVFDTFERQRKNDDERVIIAAKNSFMMRFALICLIATTDIQLYELTRSC